MPRRPGTSLISRNPSNLPNIAPKASTSYSSGIFCKNKILFGGKYSSGITCEAAGPVDFSPDGLESLLGLFSVAGSAPLLACRSLSAASKARRLSARKSEQEKNYTPIPSYLSLPNVASYVHRSPLANNLSLPFCRFAFWLETVSLACRTTESPEDLQSRFAHCQSR